MLDQTPSRPLWDIDETAGNLRISRSLLLKKTYQGEIPSIKIGKRRLYVPDKIFEWLNERPQIAAGDENLR